MCCIILSSSGKYQRRYKQSGRISGTIAGDDQVKVVSHKLANFWRCCRGDIIKIYQVPNHKYHLLAINLFAICLSFSSPPLLKCFCKNRKIFFRLPFLLPVCLFAYFAFMTRKTEKKQEITDGSSSS